MGRSWTIGLFLSAALALAGEPPAPPPAPPAEGEEVPEGAEPAVLVSSRDITFEWEAPEEIGPVSEIEVWQTRDGKAWEKVLTQKGDEPSITVKVLADGWYGFSVAAVGEGAAREEAPAEGESPEISAFVDTMGPKVHSFAPPADGSLWDPDETMPIAWAVSDDAGVKEVLVEFRPMGEPDWRPVARQGGGAGETAWVVPRLPADGFDLALTAMDRAGNRSEPAIRSYRYRTPPMRVPVVLHGPASTREHEIELSVEISPADWKRLSGVELWQTADSGRTWRRLDAAFAADRRALRVPLSATGRYGFFVRPVLEGEPPLEQMASGVLPHLDCWAQFPAPVATVERQAPPSKEARDQARRLYLAGQAALARWDAAEARRCLGEVLKIWPEFAPALNDLACLEMKAGKLDLAEDLLLKAADLEPQDADYRYNLGLCLLSQGKALEAVEPFTKAAQDGSPRRAEAMLALAECRAALGEMDKAVEIARQALSIASAPELQDRIRRRLAAWGAREPR